VTGGTRGRDVPFGGCEASVAARGLSPGSGPPLVRLPSPSAHSRPKLVARHWFRAPSTSFPEPARRERHTADPSVRSAGPRGVPGLAGRRRPEPATGHSRSRALSRVWPPRIAAHLPWPCHGSRAHAVPPGVSSPSAHPGRSVYVAAPGLPHPVRSASRVSHPPDGLLRPDPSGLVSSRSRQRGSTLQSFPLPRSRGASRRPMPS
jgi:hypothetical protein